MSVDPSLELCPVIANGFCTLLIPQNETIGQCFIAAGSALTQSEKSCYVVFLPEGGGSGVISDVGDYSTD